MNTRTYTDSDIIQCRLLYTALIKAALIAWGRGYPAANPHCDPFKLSKDKARIVAQIVAHFDDSPGPRENGTLSAAPSPIPGDAGQIAPILESIAALHRAVTRSGQKYARQIAGETELETMKNLIAFFTECPQ